MFQNKSDKTCFRRVSPVFTLITDCFALLFAGDKTVIPDESKKQLEETLHLSLKMLADGIMFWCTWDAEGHGDQIQHMNGMPEFRLEFKTGNTVDQKDQLTGIDRDPKKKTSGLHRKNA